MAYIGTKPTIGNFQICDAISVVNGQAAYTMQVGGVNVSPQSSNHMIVSLNGTIQKPGGANPSFTVSGSTITFASNLATGDVIDFIQILGDVLDLGVPSDATVSTAKLADSAVTAAKINDNAVTSAKLGTDVALGKVLQIVSQQYTTPITVSGVTNTFVDSTITASITPSSSSNKVIVWFNVSVANTTSTGNRVSLKLKRGSTDIGIGTGTTGNRIVGTANALYEGNDPYEPMTIPILWYDTPATTSATTYKVAVASNSNTSQNVYFNRSRDDADNNDNFRTVTQVLLVEVAG
jgi:hypothetical protein